MIFRLYHKRMGRHVHCRLFAGEAGTTLACNGHLVFTEAEFMVFRAYNIKLYEFIERKDSGDDDAKRDDEPKSVLHLRRDV